MNDTVIETLWRIATDITELRQRLVDNDHATRAAEKVSTEARRVADAANDEVRRLRERIETLESQAMDAHRPPSGTDDTPPVSTDTPLPSWIDVDRLVRMLASHFGVYVSHRAAMEFAREFVAMMPTSEAHPKFCCCPPCLHAARQGKP